MKPIKLTKEYGSANTLTMECWFCNQTMLISNFNYCSSENCKQHYVAYIFYELHYSNVTFELQYVQFKTQIKSREYAINHFPLQKKLEVLEKKPLPILDSDNKFTFTKIFSVSCDSIILTPHNAETRLPTLITFS